MARGTEPRIQRHGFPSNSLNRFMTTERDPGFIQIAPESFEEFLKTANDYTRESIGSVVQFRWRHNGKHFADVEGELFKPSAVWVDPAILSNP